MIAHQKFRPRVEGHKKCRVSRSTMIPVVLPCHFACGRQLKFRPFLHFPHGAARASPSNHGQTAADHQQKPQAAPGGDHQQQQSEVQPSLRLTEAQLSSFDTLKRGMRAFAQMAVAASAVSVTQVVAQSVIMGTLQVPPSGVSYIIVHLVTASVVWRSAALLPQLGTPPQLHKPELMHGLRALAVVFVQIGTMHWFMSAVTMMSAAIIWPPLIRVFSSLVAGVCIMRLFALGYVLEQYMPEHRAADEEELRVASVIGAGVRERLPWLDRATTLAIGGSLSFASTPAARSTMPQPEDGAPEYEFNDVEDRTFTSLMSSMQGAGAAASLLCLAHMMACTAKLFVRSVPTGQAVESLSAGIEAGAMAGIVFYSAGCFAAILSTRGHDVRLLMQGVAGGTGLVNLFRRLTKVQTAVVVGAMIQIIVKLSEYVPGWSA